MKKIFKGFSLLVMLSILLAACAAPTPVPVQKQILDSIPREFKEAYVGYNATYSQRYDLDNTLSVRYANWQEDYNKFVTSNRESLSVISQCQADYEDAVLKLAAGIFGTDGKGNPVSKDVEQKAFINALGLSGNVTGIDNKKCQDMAAELVTSARGGRSGLTNLRSEMNVLIGNIEKWENGTVQSDLATQFANKYGTKIDEMAQNGQLGLLTALSQQNNFKVIEFDFIGYPTKGAYVRLSGSKTCAKVDAMYRGATPTPNGESAKLFLIEWLDKDAGNCIVYRKAAWNIMRTLFVSAETNTRLNCQQDADFTVKLDPVTCKPIEPTKRPQ